jgi:hypothetical protein
VISTIIDTAESGILEKLQQFTNERATVSFITRKTERLDAGLSPIIDKLGGQQDKPLVVPPVQTVLEELDKNEDSACLMNVYRNSGYKTDY